jgi:hypothetical protein
MIGAWSHPNNSRSTWEKQFQPKVGHVVHAGASALYFALYDGVLLGKFFTLLEAQTCVEEYDRSRVRR